MSEQIINTGDAATDQQIAEEIRKGMEAGGLKAAIVTAPGGGLCVRAELPPAVKAVAAAPTPGISMTALEPGAFELGGTEGYALKQRVLEGSFAELRKLLRETSARKDWEDRHFMTDIVIGSSLPGSLDEAVAREPNAADLRLLRGAYAVGRAWQARGTGTVDQITEAQWADAREWVNQAKVDLTQAASALPGDPTPLAFLMNGLIIFGEYKNQLLGAYREALERAPDFSVPYWIMVNERSQKWGGSHRESLQVARDAASKARPGGDAHACLFRAHTLVWQYAKYFEGDEATATAYLTRPDVRDELARAFDAWVKEPYAPRRASVAKLHWPAFWFFRTGDKPRLKRAMAGINNIICETPWCYEEGGPLLYTQALQSILGS
jgi:hypothetical protein